LIGNLCQSYYTPLLLSPETTQGDLLVFDLLVLELKRREKKKKDKLSQE
jgi:hypothetical protein